MGRDDIKVIENKISKVSTVAKTPFVGLYDVEYKNKINEDKNWTVASRKSIEQLKGMYLENKQDKVDAVVIAAFHRESKKMVLIKQFRVPINNYIYELPAGLIDNDEETDKAVARELKEETGLNIVSINSSKSKDKLYLSPGMTDESVSFIFCLCEGKISKDYLEDDEDIEAILISQDDAKEMLNSNKTIDIKCFLMLQLFACLGAEIFE